ncbi:MAG: hypothetical protein KAT65_16765, partial [Methanophagales archaeon]|nr:hypothetical protein [Methanophagales archaeon]
YFDDLVFVDYDVNITTDDQFLDLISKRTFKYFWDTAHPTTGLMRDRATNRELCSIASVGFGLTTYCIAAERGWVSRSNAAERVAKVLNTLWDGPQGNETANVTGYNGFFYHFLDMETGYRYEPWIPSCELSSIDTALLLAGVLTCKEYFDGSDTTEDNIRNLSDNIYRRVNWTWMLNGGDTLSMGWRPETGFLPYRWEGYNEAMILYLLAIGSPNQNHSLPNSSWDAWAKTYKWGCGDGEDFIYCPTGSLFTYQYSHCWIDFRNKHDAHADYWQNSINAVKENRQFCIDNSDIYPTYGENCWGLTACDCPNGYCGYGSCPAYYHDGTIAPTGAGGSVALVPDLAIPALRFMYTEYGDKLWGVYGFRDAFNLDTDLSKPGNQEWWDKDYIGIDEGAVIVMIENFRSGLVWNEFMQNPYIIKAMDDGGFVLTSFDTGHGTYPSIFGSHNGTIKPLLNINVTRMYTYPCAGTGRHCEYVKFWNSTWNVSATLKGYAGDWHNITFDVPFVFEQGKIYNYTIRTGFYPQIHHTDRLKIDDGVITCISFVDANGKKYDNCIPAIGLE